MIKLIRTYVRERLMIEAKRSKKSSIASRLGKCYQVAGSYASSHPDSTLVHGSIQGFGNPRIDHAWVELANGDVYEAVWDKVLDKQVFEAVFNPIVTKKYDHEQLLGQTLRTHHWGPWEDEA